MEVVKFLFNVKEWWFFIKRLGILIVVLIAFFLSWVCLGSVLTAPFYASTKSVEVQGFKQYGLEGETTTRAIQLGLKELVNDGLVTNFIGVRSIIDNNLNEQIGSIEMYRVAMNGLENNLGRNRGTGGANEYLEKARSNIYADYSVPYFTSYTTLLNKSIQNIDDYLIQLVKDKDKPMESKKAVFIVNSDNLAETLDKLKQQLQTNLAMPVNNFTQVDDKFYKIKGNLRALHIILKGMDVDFKSKMIDKSCYNENFLPILEDAKKGGLENHFIVLETFGDLSKMEKQGNIVSQKLSELIDKLKKG